MNIKINILIEDIDDIILYVEDIDNIDDDVDIYNISTSLNLLNRIKTLNFYHNIKEIDIDSNINFKDDKKIIDLIKKIVDEDVEIYYN